jgi:hypothetical protein
MYANREGLFNAYPINCGVADTGQNNLATVVIQFHLFEELVNGEWTDCSAESMELTGYFYLEKRDGQVNTSAVDSLRAALGWNTDDPAWIQQTDLSHVPVQVKLANEEYNGKTKLKVQFLNPYGSMAGSVPKGDEKTHQNIRTRLSAKLRAYMGGAPAPAPKPAPRNQPAQTAPQKATTPPAKQAQAPATAKPPQTTAPRQGSEQATMEEAWAEFTSHCTGDQWTQEAIEKEWFSILSQMFPTKQPEQLSGTEWAIVKQQAPGKIIPF